MAPRSAFQPNGLAVPSMAMTPDAPKAAAARTIAPTLPGSCSAGEHEHQRQVGQRRHHDAHVGRPRARDRDDARGMLDRAHGGQDLVADRQHAAAALRHVPGDARRRGESTLPSCRRRTRRSRSGCRTRALRWTRCSPSSSTSADMTGLRRVLARAPDRARFAPGREIASRSRSGGC